MSKGSILVVDDESEIREGLELLLTSEGYGVSSGKPVNPASPSSASTLSICCCLMLACPRNGLEMLREIRKRDPQLSSS